MNPIKSFVSNLLIIQGDLHRIQQFFHTCKNKDDIISFKNYSNDGCKLICAIQLPIMSYHGIIRFESLNEAPFDIIQNMSEKNPDLLFTIYYCSNKISYGDSFICGVHVFMTGKVISTYDENSDTDLQLAKIVFPELYSKFDESYDD